MKNLFKLKTIQRIVGIIALVAVIGFSMAGCDNGIGDGDGTGTGTGTGTGPGTGTGTGPGTGVGTDENGNPTVGSGQYASKDVLGNSYSISVGSNASARAALKNDRFSLDVTGRDGNTRKAYGTVKDISADGTLTLKTEDGVEFTAVVGENSLDSVASNGAEITFSDGTTLVPRTFNNIYLRANRWGGGNQRGEQYASGLSVLVKDFPTNVSRLEKGTHGRYTITISGTVDRALDHVAVEVQGVKENDEWVWLGSNNNQISISAGTFNETVSLDVGSDDVSYDLLDYKEVILQVTEVLRYENVDHPDWNQIYGSIPADIPDGQIMATISNFNISLIDTARYAFKGNTNDYYYGFKEDGFSIDYRQAVWKLTPENIAAVKQANAKFEFILMDNNIGENEYAGPTLDFIWQDPVRGLWWQDQIRISGGDEGDGKYKFYEGAIWDAYRNKVTLDLSSLINDSRFAASTQLNFIIACWYNEGEACRSIGDLTITGANIYNVPDCAGNMGNYLFGYHEDGISIQYTQIAWHLPEEILTTAQESGAKLEIVFTKDLPSVSACLALVWVDIPTNRWWPSAEESAENTNLILTGWKLDGSTESYQYHSGVTYDSTTKKLTVVLPTALETYSDSAAKPTDQGRIGFESATDVNFVLTCWYGVTNNITELGIVSANIVSGL